VLGVAAVGIDDNFFELAAIRCSLRAWSADPRGAGRELPVRSLFDRPTVPGCGTLRGRPARGARTGRAVNRPDRIPLSHGQQRLWFIHHLTARARVQHPGRLRLSGKLEPRGGCRRAA